MATAIEPTSAFGDTDPELRRKRGDTVSAPGPSDDLRLEPAPAPGSATTLLTPLSKFLQAQRDDAEELGIKKAGLPLRYRDLSVYGLGSGEMLVSSLPIALAKGLSAPARALFALGKEVWHRTGFGAPAWSIPPGCREGERRILHRMSGVVEQGEMLLVLGRPGAGVTILLRTLAHDREGLSHFEGHVDYGTLGSAPVEGPLRGEVAFLGEADSHFATITLEDTLLVAARCKTPSIRKDEVTRPDWARAQIAAWTSALGLAHARQTPVGSELVKGLSGGERKRASVIEAVLTRASVLCLDNATSGLDSRSAVSLLAALKEWATIGGRSVVAGLRQVGEPVYETFDKVCVLYHGRQVYFGPANRARGYFEALGFTPIPGQTTADFLCSVTDAQTRHISRDATATAPRKPDDFVKLFWKSDLGGQLKESLSLYESRYPPAGAAEHVMLATRAEKDSLTPQTSQWTVNVFRQVCYLTRRQYALVSADLKPYITKTVVNVILSVIVGTLFFQLPQTTEAAFTRGSVLLLSILFNGYLQLAELGNTLVGRPVVKRHGFLGFYGPGCLAVARTLGDLPLIAVQVALFATITYVLAGLQRTWEHFFVYLLIVYATALNLTTVFRMFAALSPSFDEAMRYCGIALNIFVVYAGYFIPTPSMRSFLKPIRYYIDPISYAYEAVLANEFRNLTLACSPSDVIPRGPGYDDPRYQTCSIAGSRPGSLLVSGERYLSVAYDFHHDNIGRNLGVILLLAVIFLVIGVVATEFFSFAPSGSVKVFARTKAVHKRFASHKNIKDVEGTAGQYSREASFNGRSNGHDSATSGDVDTVALTWKDLGLWVNTPTETRQLLDRISGYIKPSECTALMGPSGAGKTTLLNALAGRSGQAIVKGDVRTNGHRPDSTFYQSVGFVEQLDIHDEQSTIREALTFSALLRQPKCVPRSERLAYVDYVLDLLGLASLQDAIVGKCNAGLGLEDRKRLTIAVELCARPSILFLDEPTSGLDSQSALHIVQLMCKLARTGLAVIATIHQPSAEIFDHFDNLLLLERGGTQVYFGPRANAVAYFEARCSILCDANDNPAEFLIDAASSGNVLEHGKPGSVTSRDTMGLHGLALKWRASREYLNISRELEGLVKRLAVERPNRMDPRGATTWQQSVELTKRLSRHFWRDASFSYTKILTSLAIAVIIGLSFWQAELTVAGLQNRMFSVFLILFIPPVFMNQLIVKWFTMRGLWEGREKPARVYGNIALCTSFLLAELPYCLVGATVFWLIWYLAVGFPLVVGKALFSFLMVQLFFHFQSFLAIAVAALAPTIGVVANLLPFFLVSMEAFNGSLIPYAQIPVYWKWMYWVSPFQWYIKAMLSEILHGLEVNCAPSEVVYFFSPPLQSCERYLAPFLKRNPGKLVASTDSTCGYCRFATGDDFLALLDFGFDKRWPAMAVFAFYTCFNAGMAYFFVCDGRQKIAALGRELLRRLRGKPAIALD